MKKVVIVWSTSLQDKISLWLKYWNNNYDVIAYPKKIEKEFFLEKYPNIHINFFKNIIKSDIVFLMNENKNNIKWYIWAESFAEICFAVSQNKINNKNIDILILQKPDKNVQCYDEINLWLELWWIRIFEK